MATFGENLDTFLSSLTEFCKHTLLIKMMSNFQSCRKNVAKIGFSRALAALTIWSNKSRYDDVMICLDSDVIKA